MVRAARCAAGNKRIRKNPLITPWVVLGGFSTEIHVLYDREAYRRRNVIERLIGWLKECRRVLTRFEKTAKNFGGFRKMAFIQRYLRIMTAWRFQTEPKKYGSSSSRMPLFSIRPTNGQRRIKREEATSSYEKTPTGRVACWDRNYPTSAQNRVATRLGNWMSESKAYHVFRGLLSRRDAHDLSGVRSIFRDSASWRDYKTFAPFFTTLRAEIIF